MSTVPEAVVKASGVDGGSGSETGINKDLQNLYDGLKMTERVLLGTLTKHGLERFDPAEKGDKFDPNIHDASFMAPMPDKEDGSVFTTIQKGFILNGRVVRVSFFLHSGVGRTDFCVGCQSWSGEKLVIHNCMQ